MAFDATIGGTSANSYSTLALADTYFTDRGLTVTAWTGETDARKQNALMMATWRIDSEEFTGNKNASGQALKWPRNWAVDDNGDEWDGDEIPYIVQQATYELALQYLIDDDNGTNPTLDTGLEEFDTAKVGPLDFKRDQSFKAGQLPANVRRLLRLVVITAGNSVVMERA